MVSYTGIGRFSYIKKKKIKKGYYFSFLFLLFPNNFFYFLPETLNCVHQVSLKVDIWWFISNGLPVVMSSMTEIIPRTILKTYLTHQPPSLSFSIYLFALKFPMTGKLYSSERNVSSAWSLYFFLLKFGKIKSANVSSTLNITLSTG